MKSGENLFVIHSKHYVYTATSRQINNDPGNISEEFVSSLAETVKLASLHSYVIKFLTFQNFRTEEQSYFPE
jgi:hypothetical protein